MTCFRSFTRVMCTAVCAFVTVLVIPGLSRADGLLDAVDSKAEQYLADYVLGREDLPRSQVYIARIASSSLVKSRDDIYEVESWMIEARLPRQGNETAALSVMSRQAHVPGLVQPQLWEQTLSVNGKRYYRRNSTGTSSGVNESEKSDTAEEESVTRRAMPIADPYFLPFADTGPYLRSKANRDFAEDFMVRYSLVSARREDGGVLGVWSPAKNPLASWRVSILFDPAQGNMPTRVHWEIGRAVENAPQDGSNKGLVYKSQTSTRTQWQPIEVDPPGREKVTRWIPKLVTRVDAYTGDDFTETNFCFVWKRIEESDFPKPEDDDWRSPFAKLFDLDWGESYQSFVSRVAKD